MNEKLEQLIADVRAKTHEVYQISSSINEDKITFVIRWYAASAQCTYPISIADEDGAADKIKNELGDALNNDAKGL